MSVKYTFDKDKAQWIEIEGAASLTMRELNALFTGEQRDMFALAAGVVKLAHLMDRHGEEVNASDATQIDRLTLAQWDWLRHSIIAAARDEALDPEA
jgi:S-adenosylmethionine hydrolase